MGVSFLDFYKGKRVLVTGDTGFKGSWLCLWLRELGAEVAGFALPPGREDDHYNLLKLGDMIRHVSGDIRDLDSLEAAFGDFKPEILFHLAAQSIVRVSYDSPKETFDTNVGGSVNVLEAVRVTPSLRSVVYVTSDKCYRNNEWLWGYRENDVLGGHDPYSASKAAAELIFSSYMDSFISRRDGLGAASVRAGNVIGGGDWSPARIVPDCIRALREGRPIEIRNPHSTRPWQHVLEPLAGYLLLGARLYEDPKAFSGAWNFGPDDDAVRTVGELAEKIVGRWGAGSLRISPSAHAPHEARLLRLNCDKARSLLKWRPRWDFTTAVNETVDWYKEVSSGVTALAASRARIKDYTEVLND
ncbi:MAG: CDP-glucose 4,6-dehydratase [Deltaproteobacteria bacterium]|nr:CDP-glucose 4,6-dehydratase [Deltaproteobacteria bacterium]